MSINRSDINSPSPEESSPQIERAPALAPLVAPKPKGGSSLLLVMAALVAVAGLAFAGGRISAPAAGLPGRGSFAGFPTASGAPGAAAFGAAAGERTVKGTISALSATSLTLTTATGSETISLAPTTTYHAQAAAVAADAAVGSKVIVSVNTPAFTGGAVPGAGAGTGAGTGTAGADNGAGTTPRAISATDVLIESK